VDSGTDKPADARADIKLLTDRVNSLESILKTVLENGSPLVYEPGGLVEMRVQPGQTAVGKLRAMGGLFLGNAAIDSSDTLDWYEEGSVTPSVQAGSGVATMGFSEMTYVRVGKLVVANFVVQWSSHTGTGVFRFGNFPYLNPFSAKPSRLLHAQVKTSGIPTSFNNLFLVSSSVIGFLQIQQFNINNGANADLAIGYQGGSGGSFSGSIIYTATGS